MIETESPLAQRMAIASAVTVAVLCLAYAVVLVLGLALLPSPQHQIQDPLAWDVFFPLAAMFAAPTVRGPARRLLYGSAALAFLGLAGVPLANMQVRNIGILGYAVLFPIAAARLAREFSHAWRVRAA